MDMSRTRVAVVCIALVTMLGIDQGKFAS